MSLVPHPEASMRPEARLAIMGKTWYFVCETVGPHREQVEREGYCDLSFLLWGSQGATRESQAPISNPTSAM